MAYEGVAGVALLSEEEFIHQSSITYRITSKAIRQFKVETFFETMRVGKTFKIEVPDP